HHDITQYINLLDKQLILVALKQIYRKKVTTTFNAISSIIRHGLLNPGNIDIPLSYGGLHFANPVSFCEGINTWLQS
ncbi:MAG: hypothetical protein U9R69_07475, partial [Thermodesulfobacteriota bacterium]|nr:hypothetical protein [Thermodesulfobacteriota bacterium]